MINLQDYTIMTVALMPLAFLLAIWSIEYAYKKIVLVGAWMLGTIGLKVMGEP